ncbi:MAG TPA: flagella basal body P-ring formation protein FlgA [Gammaproteobacteria bacterium]|nr:flagella basal body P-ring formation protein FlgA [Gammaproteobacteria bacterium]
MQHISRHSVYVGSVPSRPGHARSSLSSGFASPGLGRHAGHVKFMIWAVLLAFLTPQGIGDTSDIATNEALEPKAQLSAELTAWMALKFPAGQYTFLLGDQRLAIPACAGFAFSSTSSANAQSILVEARCSDPAWSRLIRGRSEQGAAAPALEQTTVWTVDENVPKGRRITPGIVRQVQMSKRGVPQNALKGGFMERPVFARRPLRAGNVLTQLDIANLQKVLVLRTALPARSPIDANSIQVAYRAVDVPRDAVKSKSGLNMFATSRALHPGDILRRRDMTKAKLIKRGQNVSVVSAGDHFSIQSELIALQDGYLGQQIRLANPDSQRRVSAVVTGPSTARTIGSSDG